MADIIGYFPATLAVDINTRIPLRDVEAKVYALSDTNFNTPLAVTDMAGVPLNGNAVVSNSDGIFPEFRAPAGITQVILKAGQALTPMTSVSVYAEAAERSASEADEAAQMASSAERNASKARDDAEKAADTVDPRVQQAVVDANIPGKAANEIAGAVAAYSANLPQVFTNLDRYSEIWTDTNGVVWAWIDGGGRLHTLSLTEESDAWMMPEIGSAGGPIHIDQGPNGEVFRHISGQGEWYIDRLTVRDLTTQPAVIQRVSVVGDSTAADNGQLGGSIATYLQELTALPVFPGGVPAQTASEVSLRMGGEQLALTFPNNVVASGAQTVTPRSPGNWRNGNGYVLGVGEVMATDGSWVTGTLSKSTTNVFTFNATLPPGVTSMTVAVEAPFRMIPFYRQGVNGTRNWLHILRFGRNNLLPGQDPDPLTTIIRCIEAARREALRADRNARFMILPIYTDDAYGTSGYTLRESIHKEMQKRWPDDWYDLRGWIIRNGLAAAGLSATADDNTAIAEDRIPPQLTTDNTPHMTLAGRRVEARQIFTVARSRGLL